MARLQLEPGAKVQQTSSPDLPTSLHVTAMTGHTNTTPAANEGYLYPWPSNWCWPLTPGIWGLVIILRGGEQDGVQLMAVLPST